MGSPGRGRLFRPRPAPEDLDGVSQRVTPGQALAGQPLFDFALSLTNGRSCATLSPAERAHRAVPGQRRGPTGAGQSDPLFNAIDADDPTAAVPTYQHLLRAWSASRCRCRKMSTSSMPRARW